MDRDSALSAKCPPERKVREVRNGAEQEDWIYGLPPHVLFVTFDGDTVVAVRQYRSLECGSSLPLSCAGACSRLPLTSSCVPLLPLRSSPQERAVASHSSMKAVPRHRTPKPIRQVCRQSLVDNLAGFCPQRPLGPTMLQGRVRFGILSCLTQAHGAADCRCRVCV